jgi:hypothetical protein
MIKIESLGSFWFLDYNTMTYHHTPKVEDERPNGWGTKEGPLQDLAAHPFTRVELVTNDPRLKFWHVPAALRIHYRGAVRDTPLGRGCFVHAPLTQAQYEEARLLLDGKRS